MRKIHRTARKGSPTRKRRLRCAGLAALVLCLACILLMRRHVYDSGAKN